MGLAHINASGNIYSYDPGMVIWYVDESYTDNWVGEHPGDGFLGVVDADQNVNYWNDAKVGQLLASTRYQIHDAAFGLQKILGWH
jgi:immune inhibitor A